MNFRYGIISTLWCEPKQWKRELDLLEAVEKDFGITILPLKKEHLHT